MADFSDKINELLANPETVAKIMQIAKGLTLNNGSPQATENPSSTPAAAVPSPATAAVSTSSNAVPASGIASLLTSGNALDILSSLGKGSPNIGSDRRVVLLNAIKPFIAEHKQKRLEGIISAISISTALGKMKGV